ncbi:hypothetical protein OPV22_005018 [Ensete ventricosum]|uniref:Uncharacterized protein n=1 Tax=Ensete ventricosum TaxID=4639 RepID=A0AAV8Q055_ENSVE|nr:hypothetical protein OPV22_005018 [Ensete ventricosum]
MQNDDVPFTHADVSLPGRNFGYRPTARPRHRADEAREVVRREYYSVKTTDGINKKSKKPGEGEKLEEEKHLREFFFLLCPGKKFDFVHPLAEPVRLLFLGVRRPEAPATGSRRPRVSVLGSRYWFAERSGVFWRPHIPPPDLSGNSAGGSACWDSLPTEIKRRLLITDPGF